MKKVFIASFVLVISCSAFAQQAGRVKISFAGFKCLKETADDILHLDGKADEVFLRFYFTLADKSGNPVKGIACYVTNYGYAFRDVRNSLQLAQDGGHPKNTVCIAYVPSMEEGYEIQFFVYGPAGLRQV